MKHLSRWGIVGLLSVLFLLASCGSGASSGGGGGINPPPSNPGPTVTPNLRAVTLSPGDSTTIGITVGKDGGGQVQLSLSGVPSGVTATLAGEVIAAGGSTGLYLMVDSGAASGTSTLTVTASRGGSSSTFTISLSVPQATAQASLPLPAYVPGSMGVNALTFDKVHKLGFGLDSDTNRVVVITPDTGRIIKTIHVANPLSIDACLDGSRIYVGTQNDVGAVLAIDPVKLEVVQSYSWTAATGRPGGVSSIACTSTGVPVVAAGYFVAALKTNGFTRLSPTPAYAGTFRVAPNRDHSAIYVFSTDGVQKYDSVGDSFSAPITTDVVKYIQANPSNSQLAVVSGPMGTNAKLRIMTEDWAEIILGNVATPFGFSADGSKVLLSSFYPINDIMAYSATDLSKLGLLSSTNMRYVGTPTVVPIDQKLMFFISNDGVRIFDSSEMGPAPTNPGGPDILAFDTQVVPVGRESQLVLLGRTPTVENIWFSSVHATAGVPACDLAGNCRTNVTVPATVTPGLATTTVHYGGGWKTVITNQFTIGPDFETLFPAGGPAGIGVGVDGWGVPFLTSQGDIYFGGTIAPHSPSFNAPNLNGTVNVTVVTPNGSATKPKAFTYIRESLTPVSGSISDMLYDSGRHLIYLSDYTNNRVDVFSTSSKQIITSFPVGKNPRGMGLSSDGKKLFVANMGDSSISIVDPDGVTATSKITVLPPQPWYPAIKPEFVTSIDANRAFVGEHSHSNYIVDLTTGSSTGTALGLAGPRLGDTGRITIEGGCLWTIATSDLECPPARYSTSLIDVSPDGSRILSGFDLLDSDLNYLSRSIALQYFTQSFYSRYGNTKLHATGGLVYWAYSAGGAVVMLSDAYTGEMLTEQASTHALLLKENSIDRPIHNLTTDASGKNAYVLTTDGLVVLTTDQLPLSTGIITPSSGAQGTLITIKGTGFQNGITASFGTTALSTTLLDENTIQVVAPASSSGSKLILRNPDGSIYVRERVFDY